MNVAANQIVKINRPRLHLEADDVRRIFRRDREHAAAAGIAVRDAGPFGGQTLGVELLDRAIAGVGVAAPHKFFSPLAIAAQAIALVDRSLVPVDPQPLQ